MGKRVVDLSLVIQEGQKGPISEVKILQEMTRQISGRHFKKPCEGFESRNIIISEHCGTHVDAPYHFVPDTNTIDQVSVDQFIGDAVCIDLRGIQGKNEPTRKEHLIAVCKKYDINIRKGDIVVLLSESESKGLTDDAVEWLVDKEIKGVGTNIFIEEDRTEEDLKVRYAHVSFLSRGISIFEGLTNLDKIECKRFFFVGLPLKIYKGTGSPIRAIAICN